MRELVGERRRESEKEGEIERERRGSETDVPKLYTYNNEYELSVLAWALAIDYTPALSAPLFGPLASLASPVLKTVVVIYRK